MPVNERYVQNNMIIKEIKLKLIKSTFNFFPYSPKNEKIKLVIAKIMLIKFKDNQILCFENH